MEKSLIGKTAVITGGSRGIGEAITYRLASLASARISAARSVAAVSVEKNGEPVPQAKSTILPCSRYSMALRVS